RELPGKSEPHLFRPGNRSKPTPRLPGRQIRYGFRTGPL
ncbi:uncharacterized protein METZ01_LOCUS240464, partial [marine metagenome]